MHEIIVFIGLTCCISGLPGDEAYPSFVGVTQANGSDFECGYPTQLSFSAREVADGTFFKAIADFDPDSKRLLYQLEE